MRIHVGVTSVLLLIFIMAGGLDHVKGQGVSITLLTFEGYTFSDRIDFSNGYGEIGDGFQWGVGFELGLSDVNAAEIYYQRMTSPGKIKPILGEVERGDVGINYIMFGGTRYLPLNAAVSAFGSMDLGVAVLSPSDNSSLSNSTKVAWGMRGGIRISPAERLSFRLHAQLLSPIQGASGGFYFGTGGSGAGVSTYSSIYQFNLGGSVNILLK